MSAHRQYSAYDCTLNSNCRQFSSCNCTLDSDCRQFSSCSCTWNSDRGQPFYKTLLNMITHYETPKVVRFESKWIASLSLFVKLSLAFGCLYLMLQRNSYQIYDRSPISAVIIEVTPATNCSKDPSITVHIPAYNCRPSRYDVNDFILPATENSAVSITTRMKETEHILTFCNMSHLNLDQRLRKMNLVGQYECDAGSRCIIPPFAHKGYENETIANQTQFCWYKLSDSPSKINYQALDYLLFVKNFVEFPQLKIFHNNFAKNMVHNSNISTCEYHNVTSPLCPRFRVLTILQQIEGDTSQYKSMFHKGSLIEIKISWDCNLDPGSRRCEPQYGFKRLDHTPYEKNPFQPGSSFITSKHFFRPNDGYLHRLHTNIYNLHIIVSVTGAVGKFDLFQTTTSIGSFIGIFGAGTIVCDLIAAFFTNFKRVKYDS